MRVVLISEAFSRRMGYLENTLPPLLARNGADVHVLTAGLPPYYFAPDFEETFAGFNDFDELRPGTEEVLEGYTLHVLPYRRSLGYVRLCGLAEKLRQLQPDIVQTTTAIGWVPLDLLLYKLRLRFKLFTGSHTAASNFPLAQQRLPWWHLEMLRCRLLRTFPGALASLAAEKCYAVTSDCAEIASRYFGVPRRKVTIMHLGVETDRFHPVRTPEEAAARAALRAQLGFTDEDIVCIYTGKLSERKDPLIVARAIQRLRARGYPYSGLFIGEGTQRAAIQQLPYCATLPFMEYRELPPYYRAADIGVWPSDESTSMLDAAASGLPLVVSDGIYRDHVDGNGRVFRLGDMESLVVNLAELRDPELRLALGKAGAAKMRERFSIESVALRRLRDYEAALNGTARQSPRAISHMTD